MAWGCGCGDVAGGRVCSGGNEAWEMCFERGREGGRRGREGRRVGGREEMEGGEGGRVGGSFFLLFTHSFLVLFVVGVREKDW